jgi:hypothetical protein
MKFRNSSRTLLALAGCAALALGLTSCTADYTVGYVYVLGTTAAGQTAGEINAFREDNNNGALVNVIGSPTTSGGDNPVRAVIPSGNRFVYVLNAGVPATDSSGNTTYSSSNVSLFSIGGYGQLSPQQQYGSQGFGSRRIAVDSAGAYLFVLDQYANVGVGNATAAPTASHTYDPVNYPCQDATNPAIYHPVGAITVFSIDGSTGRLGVQQNQRQQNLTYFPVGCDPVDFRLASGYLYTMDRGSVSRGDQQTVNIYSVAGGQLTPTQTSQIKVANDSDITAITGDGGSGATGGSHIYLLDTAKNRIFLYTVGTNGALVAVTGSPYNNAGNTQAGGPVQTLTDSTGKYLYVINGGPAGGTSNSSSDIGGYSVNASTGFLDANTQASPYAGTVGGPVCIFEDPTNQFIYVAGSTDNSITGRRLDPNTGTLRPLNVTATVPTVGTPSWCLGISSAL